MTKNNIILIVIILTAFFLRFWQLGINPPSLTWDEVAWGYNSYSLGIDGKDEFGKVLPYAYFESFGDFKPPMYAYLGIIPIKLFGLNEFATRFPSAFFGVATVLLTYLLVNQLFLESKRRQMYGLVAAFLLAISPWHIMLSRAAFEANVATFFLVAGVYSFLKAVQEKKYFLFLAVFCFVASMYTFNSARVVAPFLILLLAVGSWKRLWEIKQTTILSALFGILLLLPIVPFLLSPQAQLRFKEVNIFTDIAVVQGANQQIANDNNAWWSKIIHNRRLAYGQSFLHHYFDNLSVDFLFIKGDGNPKFSTQDVGQLYLWELPFIFVGGFLLFLKREGKWWLLPLWILLGIIPAAVARETPHALRIESTLPVWQILTALGVVNGYYYLRTKVANKMLYRFIVIGVLFVLVLNISYFLHGYYAHYSKQFSREWQFGYKESIAYVQSTSNLYDEIHMTTNLGRPYIYYLFYLQTDPRKFRESAKISRDVFGFVKVEQYDKYHFLDDVSDSAKKNKKILYIDVQSHMPEQANVLKEFNPLDGSPGLVAYTLN